MKVNIYKEGPTWRVILIPDDDVELGIVKKLDGASCKMAQDVKLAGGHIPDALVVEQPRKESSVEESNSQN